MKGRASLALALAIAIAGTAYVVHRERLVREQRNHGLRLSPNSDEGEPYSTSLFVVGDVFLSFESTPSASTLWLMRRRETIATWLLPAPVQPTDFLKLIQWRTRGRVIWHLTGRASADLLTEFDPESNHRLAIIRANCADGTCRTTTQERALPQARLVVAAEGHAVLLNDEHFVVYKSIADLMRDSGTKIPRLSHADSNELLAQSATATLLISKTPTISGEVIREKSHGRVEMPVDGAAAGVAVSDGLQLVVDEAGRTRLWDCPASVFDENSECTVYTAPQDFPRAGPVSITDDECGVAMHRSDWIWLVRRNARTEELLQAAGIAQCGATEIMTYRARHIDYVVPKHQAVVSERHTLRLVRPV